jgi:hypothetical protein
MKITEDQMRAAKKTLDAYSEQQMDAARKDRARRERERAEAIEAAGVDLTEWATLTAKLSDYMLARPMQERVTYEINWVRRCLNRALDAYGVSFDDFIALARKDGK